MTPELLSPAGDMESLRFALLYGADAVYLGSKEFGMRASSGNFTHSELETAAAFAHRLGKRVYLTLNTLPTNNEVERLPDTIKAAAKAGIDAFIVADLGVLDLVKQHAPEVEVHFSTQAGVANYAAACAAYRLGAKRVVLARELTLQDIAQIRENTPPELELEAFVHGAMCVSVSGRCLLSQYLTGRNANRGMCAQSCRWRYALVEEKRPGSYFEIGEGEGGSYILSADDLCAAPLLDKVLQAGITSLKIEGRSKSFYYTASVTAAYRCAVEEAVHNADSAFTLPSFAADELERTSHRPYSTGFYMGEEGATLSPSCGGYIRKWQVIGVVEGQEDGRIVCRQRGKFTLGEELELLRPGIFEHLRFAPQNILNEAGEEIQATPHTKMVFSLPALQGVQVPPCSLLRKRIE